MEILQHSKEEVHNSLSISGMYENWFLDYASYVILERAVPAIYDGLKPVQRRILHAMKEIDDGKYNKVANIIGSTMQYHPHGDASIFDAIVNLGQKNLLIDTQGNWGDVRTGDAAAAARYIEARLSPFAIDVIYNPQTTSWQLSYDGRKKEPVTFPVKFPLLLAQGVEGIAVGLSTKILPHNFCEILKACIATLKDKKTSLIPDFITGGKIDASEYNDGKRGGKVRVRATIKEENKSLIIKDIPYGISTTSLIDSIIKANDKGKIKIKKVIDNTAKDIEIIVQLMPGISPSITIDALYAFTDCETSIHPNACVIIDDKPNFLNVSDILKLSVDQTVELLKKELEILEKELQEKILFGSLEKIFIENRIYRNIEECETWEAVIETIDNSLDPYKAQFYRPINKEDIVRLTEIKIKRISKFDTFKSDALIKKLEEELLKTKHHLANLIEYAIAYYENLLNKYGKDTSRKTEIINFESIKANIVAANNVKLYVNRSDGFVGFGLKKDEYVCDCSDIDDIIIFTKTGQFAVTKIQEKTFVAKDIIHVNVFKKNNERMIYNMAYLDGKTGKTYIKRFQVLSITRDKIYDLTKGNKRSRLYYFSANPNGEAETIEILLTPASKARKKIFEFDFSNLDVKGRGAGGNILTTYSVKKINLKKAGKSTLGGLDVWYDPMVGRLNYDQRGQFLGNFNTGDIVIAFYKDGTYETTSFELINRYDYNYLLDVFKINENDSFNAIYYDGNTKYYYAKRFVIETNTLNKRFSVVTNARSSKLSYIAKFPDNQIEITFKVGRNHEKREVDLANFIDIKGWKALGNKISDKQVVNIKKIINIVSTKIDPKEIIQEKPLQKEIKDKPPIRLNLFD